MMQLLTLPGNSKCADCHAPNPTWASTTFGMFICLNCSGIHRALGTHVTLVRSVELDTWTEEQAATMEHVGNVVGNQFWESRLPKNFTRPSPQDRAHLEKFIRDKYIGAVWAGSGFPPHKKTMPARTCSMGTITRAKGSGHVATGTPKFAKPMKTESGDEKVKKNAVVIAHKLVYGQGSEKKLNEEVRSENVSEVPRTEESGVLRFAKKPQEDKVQNEPTEKTRDNMGQESGSKSEAPAPTQPAVTGGTRESASDGVSKGRDEVVVQRVIDTEEPKETPNEKEPPLPRFAKRIVEKHEIKATPAKIVDKVTGKPAPAKPVAQYVPPVRDVGSQQKSRFMQQRK